MVQYEGDELCKLVPTFPKLGPLQPGGTSSGDHDRLLCVEPNETSKHPCGWAFRKRYKIDNDLITGYGRTSEYILYYSVVSLSFAGEVSSGMVKLDHVSWHYFIL